MGFTTKSTYSAMAETEPIPNNRIAMILIVVILPVFSGAAALSHELLWSRRLIDLLGATDWVTGRVLGLFFFGISIGGYFATFFNAKKFVPILQLAVVELTIALLALPAAFLPSWTDWVWQSVGSEILLSWQGAALKAAIAGVVILPPAVAMGFTLPFFVRAATDLGGNVATVGVWTYSLNTVGGVVGLWLTSTYLLGQLGAQLTMIMTIAINLVVSAMAFTLYYSVRKGKLQTAEPTSEFLEPKIQDEHVVSRQHILALSFLSGLVVLAIEVLVLRLIALVVPTSFHTTSALLANVILILAVSSILISLQNNVFGVQRWILAVGFVGCAAFCCFCPSILYQQTEELVSIRYLQGMHEQKIESINHYWLLVFWLVASVGGLALLCSGLIFPTLLSMSSQSDPTGTKLGSLLAANGIGGLLGSELTNSLLVNYFGVYQSFLILACVIALIAFWILLKFSWQLGVGVTACLGFAIFIAFQSTLGIPYLSPRSTTKYRIEDTVFGREGTLLIVEDENNSKSILMNNQYILGSTGVAVDERRQLRLPWLLHGDAKSVCCLGLATGISAGGLEDLDDPPAVTAIELSATVAGIARKNFASDTSGFFERAENRVALEDARTFIAAVSNKYDLIVGDLFRPHGAGEGRLYSVEHFQNVRRALTDNGVFCQWLPMYQMNWENFQVIAATFKTAFPNTLVVWGTADKRTPVLGLVGRNDNETWNGEQIIEQLKHANAFTQSQDSLLKIAPSLIAGVLNDDAFAGVQLNTLDNMYVEISAGNFWIMTDLTKKRPRADLDNSLIRGNVVNEFEKQLKSQTQSILPEQFREQFLRTLNTQAKR